MAREVCLRWRCRGRDWIRVLRKGRRMEGGGMLVGGSFEGGGFEDGVGLDWGFGGTRTGTETGKGSGSGSGS